MKYIKHFLLLLSSLLASGCFDLNQKLEVSDDGIAHYRFELITNKQMVNMADININDCTDIKYIKYTMPDSLSVTVDITEDETNIICTVTIDGPIQDFPKSTFGYGEKAVGFLFYVSITKGGNFRLMSELPQGDKSDLFKTSETMSYELLKAMTAGRAIRWYVSAPNIISTNGILDNERKSAHWEIPLIDYLTHSTESRSFYTLFDLQKEKHWNMWINDIRYWILSLFYSDSDLHAKKQGFNNKDEMKTYINKIKEEKKKEIKTWTESLKAVTEALSILIAYKGNLAEYYAENKKYPESNEEIDVPHRGAFDYVESLTVKQNALIATFNLTTAKPIAGKSLAIIMNYDKARRLSEWECGSIDISLEYMPNDCKKFLKINAGDN